MDIKIIELDFLVSKGFKLENELKNKLKKDGFILYELEHENYILDKLSKYPKEVSVDIYAVIKKNLEFLYAKTDTEMKLIIDRILSDIEDYLENDTLRFFIKDEILHKEISDENKFYEEFKFFWEKYYLLEYDIQDYRNIKKYETDYDEIEACYNKMRESIRNLLEQIKK